MVFWALWLLAGCAAPQSTATLVPTATPINIVSQSSAVDFPLTIGNTWVYSGTVYQGYNQATILTGTYMLTDTVVKTLPTAQDTHTIYEVARIKSVVAFPEEWQEHSWATSFSSAEPENYWFAVLDDTLYQLKWV